jgi:hypothetical protein
MEKKKLEKLKKEIDEDFINLKSDFKYLRQEKNLYKIVSIFLFFLVVFFAFQHSNLVNPDEELFGASYSISELDKLCKDKGYKRFYSVQAVPDNYNGEQFRSITGIYCKGNGDKLGAIKIFTESNECKNVTRFSGIVNTKRLEEYNLSLDDFSYFVYGEHLEFWCSGNIIDCSFSEIIKSSECYLR